MAKRWVLAVSIAAAGLPAAALALRGPIATSGGPDMVSLVGCIAYAHENFGGRQLFYPKGRKESDVLDEAFSSIVCHADCTMTTFTQTKFRGSRKEWRGKLLYVGDVWNDRIASLAVRCEEPQAQTPPKPADPVLVPTPSTGPSPFGDAPSKVAEPPAAAPKPIKSLGKSVTVTADADVYDAPGGNGTKLGILRDGAKVRLLSKKPCPDNWCNVSGDAVPGGKGWVYHNNDDPDDFQSLKF